MSRDTARSLVNANAGVVDFYSYGTTISSIAAAGISTATIQIEADSNFILTKMNYFASLAGAAVTESARVIPLVTLQINDSGSSRNLFNQALPLDVIAGNGTAPFILPVERLFRANSTITLTFTNYSSATTYRIDFGLIGYKKRG